MSRNGRDLYNGTISGHDTVHGRTVSLEYQCMLAKECFGNDLRMSYVA